MKQKRKKMTESPLELDASNYDDDQLDRVIEAILLIADEPLQATSLAATLGFTEDRMLSSLARLQDFYTGRGIELREVNNGWRFYTSEAAAQMVELYVRDGQVARLTQASLETLAVIAYKQPVSRARVSAIRGVNVDGVVKTLETRGLIEVADTDADTGALMYQTTGLFLERLGLKDLSELPQIAEYLPDLATVEDLEA
jgi:segregation and condensation protein B